MGSSFASRPPRAVRSAGEHSGERAGLRFASIGSVLERGASTVRDNMMLCMMGCVEQRRVLRPAAEICERAGAELLLVTPASTPRPPPVNAAHRSPLRPHGNHLYHEPGLRGPARSVRRSASPRSARPVTSLFRLAFGNLCSGSPGGGEGAIGRSCCFFCLAGRIWMSLAWCWLPSTPWLSASSAMVLTGKTWASKARIRRMRTVP